MLSLQVFVFEGKVLKKVKKKNHAIHEIIEWERERNENRAERDVFHSGLSERLSEKKKKKVDYISCRDLAWHSSTQQLNTPQLNMYEPQYKAVNCMFLWLLTSFKLLTSKSQEKAAVK